MVLIVAKSWGWGQRLLYHAARIIISFAASRLVAYENGHLREFRTTSIKIWDDEVSLNIKKGVSSTLVAKKITNQR